MDRGRLRCYREDTGKSTTQTARRVASIYLDARFEEGRTGWQESKKLLAVDISAQLISFREIPRSTPDPIATSNSAETLPGYPDSAFIFRPFW
jgi:hypothetical protein